MTISTLFTSITDAISNISIAGITVLDYDEIASNFQMKPYVLYPNPAENGFVTNFGVSYNSFDQGANGLTDISYTLHYRFLATQIGDMLSFTKAYGYMLDGLVKIINALITTDAPYSGRVDMQLASVSVGARTDPSGIGFHGADIALKITEMQNT